MRLSISKIKAFKACRRLYELRYIENLEPVQKPEALETGKNYHKLLEELYNGADLVNDPEYKDDYSKELAMARAYMKYIYPKFKVVEAEKWFEKELLDGDKLVGIADGIADISLNIKPLDRISRSNTNTTCYGMNRFLRICISRVSERYGTRFAVSQRFGRSRMNPKKSFLKE